MPARRGTDTSWDDSPCPDAGSGSMDFAGGEVDRRLREEPPRGSQVEPMVLKVVVRQLRVLEVVDAEQVPDVEDRQPPASRRQVDARGRFDWCRGRSCRAVGVYGGSSCARSCRRARSCTDRSRKKVASTPASTLNWRLSAVTSRLRQILDVAEPAVKIELEGAAAPGAAASSDRRSDSGAGRTRCGWNRRLSGWKNTFESQPNSMPMPRCRTTRRRAGCRALRQLARGLRLRASTRHTRLRAEQEAQVSP